MNRDHKMKVIMLSGLPGTGKTSLAQALASRLGLPLFAKDRLQSRLRVLGLADRKTADGYHMMFDLADQQLSLGVGVILDAVFPMAGFRDLVRGMAEDHEADFLPIFCHCSNMGLWKDRFNGRVQYVPDWTPVGWDEVLRIQDYFEPWREDEALFLDSVDDFKQNLERTLSWCRDLH